MPGNLFNLSLLCFFHLYLYVSYCQPLLLCYVVNSVHFHMPIYIYSGYHISGWAVCVYSPVLISFASVSWFWESFTQRLRQRYCVPALGLHLGHPYAPSGRIRDPRAQQIGSRAWLYSGTPTQKKIFAHRLSD